MQREDVGTRGVTPPLAARFSCARCGTAGASVIASVTTPFGATLMAGGLFGLAADRFGPAPVLLGFAIIAALGALLARGLEEVQAG